MERLIILTIWRMVDKVRGWQRGTYEIIEQHMPGQPFVKITGLNADRRRWVETDLLPHLCSGLHATFQRGACALTWEERA